LRLEIDRESPTPIYVQIRNRLRERILSGELPEGLRLPPERELAQHLGVNRTTVLNAYRELKAEGLVSAHVGRGTVVCRMEKPQDEGMETLSAPLHWERYLRPLPDDSRDGIMRQIWDRCPSPEVACFSCGMPDRGLFPTELMGELHTRAFREAGPEVLDLMPVEGYFPLREALADLMRHRGINASPEDVVVTGGSQQGVDL
jgi:DNA-binding transcriptional MocR family regulator